MPSYRVPTTSAFLVIITLALLGLGGALGLVVALALAAALSIGLDRLASLSPHAGHGVGALVALLAWYVAGSSLYWSLAWGVALSAYLWWLRPAKFLVVPFGSCVLVTGSAKGIGRATVLELTSTRHNFKVFAGVRDLAHGEELKRDSEQPDNIIPVLLDITNDQHVEDAVAFVRKNLGVGRLLGVVNNAAYAEAGAVEHVSIDQWRRMYDVNILGQLRVTQAFLPLLRSRVEDSAYTSRLLFVTSVLSYITLPFYTPYASSKHALRAIVDGLRTELKPWPISTILIEPPRTRTPFQEVSRKAQEGALQAARDSLDADHHRYADGLHRFIHTSKMAKSVEVEPIVHHIVQALRSPTPDTRYMLPLSSIMTGVYAILPHWVKEFVMDRYL